MTDRRWAGEAKYQALLAVAQAANSRRDLSSVLDAVASALEALVPVVFPVRVPALRERAEDIPILAEYWASRQLQ